MKKDRMMIFIIVALFAFGGLIYYRSIEREAGRRASGIEEKRPVKVKVVHPVYTSLFDTVTLVGDIEAEETVGVYARFKDRKILKILVNEGDIVRQGQLMAVLDNAITMTQVRRARGVVGRAQANLEQASSAYLTKKKEYERYRSLMKEGVISHQEFDNREGAYKEASANRSAAVQQLAEARAILSEAQLDLDNHKIVAPVSGVVSKRALDPGETANPDFPLFTISRQEKIRLTGTVPEKLFIALKIGQKAQIKVNALEGRTFEAVVHRLSPVVDVATRSGKVELKMDSKGVLKPGLYATGQIQTGAREGVVLPREAVHQLPGTPNWRVYVVSGDRVEVRPVLLGSEMGNRIELMEGVSQEDQVILTHSERLEEEGVSVEVVKE